MKTKPCTCCEDTYSCKSPLEQENERLKEDNKRFQEISIDACVSLNETLREANKYLEENKKLKELLREAIRDFQHISSKLGARCIKDGCTCCHDTAHIFLTKPEVKKILEEK